MFNLSSKALAVVLGVTVVFSGLVWEGATHIASIKASIASIQYKFTQSASDSAFLQSQFNNLKSAYTDAVTVRDSLKVQVALLTDQLETATGNVTVLTQSLADMTASFNNAVADVNVLQTEVNRLATNLTQANTDIDALDTHAQQANTATVFNAVDRNAFKAPNDLYAVPVTKTRSNNVGGGTISNFGWFGVTLNNQSLDLSANSKADFVISYEFSIDNGTTWEQGKKVDGTVFIKNKSNFGGGYLINKDGVPENSVRYPSGWDGPYSGNVIPAGTTIISNETHPETRVANIYNAITTMETPTMVRTVLDITDNYGVKQTVKFSPCTYTNSVQDNAGISIYN